jgi:uncharacterized membrane protein
VSARSFVTAAIATLCTVAGLATRLHGLGNKPFWLDEVTTLHRSALPFWAMVRDSLSFHHLPAYFWLSSFFLPLGADEAALRLPAALFGALSCGLAAMVAASLAGAEAGLLSGMLMAAAPIEVQYGQEARSYTLVICLVLIALWGLIGLLKDPARDMRGSRARWAAYAGGTLCGLMVLGVAISWFVIANLAVLAQAWRQGGLPRAFVRRWLIVQAVIAALAAPGFIAMLVLVNEVHGTFKSGLDWIPPVSWHHLQTAFQSLYMLRTSSLIADRVFDSPVPLLGPAILMLAAVGVLVLRRERTSSRLLLISVMALPIGTILISLAQPMFMPRYVLWSTAPFLVLAGVGIAAFPTRLRLAASLLVVAASFANLAPYYRTETKPLWEVAAGVVKASLAPRDVLLIDDPGAVDMMNVFLGRQHDPILPSSWTENVTEASCVLWSGGRVWALQGRVGQVDHEMLGGFLQRIAPLGAPSAVRQIGLDITLIRYDRPAGPCRAQG